MLSLVVTSLVLAWVAGLPTDRRAAAPFSAPQTRGVVSAALVKENSGLAASRVHPGVLYGHNDKGDSSHFYAIDASNGHVLAVLQVTNARNYDWEDIAVGLCGPGQSDYCIYIADTGDHGGDGAKNIIYKIKEPNEIKDQDLPVEDSLHFTWDQVDCETLMITPQCDLYVVSKVKDGQGSHIAQIPASAWTHHTFHVTDMRTRSFATSHPGPSGGDLSPNGQEMVLKLRERILYFPVSGGDVLSAFMGAFQEVPYTEEPQGEAVCFDPPSLGLFSLGEGHNQPLYFYART